MHTVPDPPDPRRLAFETEALVHLDGVFGYARWLAGDETTAEDLTQDTFLQAWRSWHQFERGTNCRGWLFTICRHLYYRQHTREQKVQTADQAELESLASAALHASLDQDERDGRFLEMPDFDGALREALGQLPEEYREVVVLSDVQDQSYAEIARLLDVPVGTVKSRLFRGRRLLQERLVHFARDAGIIAPAGGSGG